MVIPKKYQSSVLELLHEGHPEMTHMKSHVQLHVWWPSISSDIEQTVQIYTNCALTAKDPARVPLRLHMDYAGPFRGKLWLIVMDACSKWPKIHAMSTTTAQAIIHQLHKIFFTHGLLARQGEYSIH